MIGRHRRAVLATLIAVGIAGCSSRERIIIGVDAPTTFYISPTGSDASPGTSDLPWRTFTFALAHLSPGSTLVLKDGRYDPSGTGLPDIRCGAGAVNGTIAAPITLRAEHERAALLDADGRVPALFMQGCSNWIIEGLRGRSVDQAGSATVTDAGSVFALGSDNHQIVLRRLLASHPNRYLHSHGVRVGEASTDVLVEECEVYDYHQNGIETVRTSNVTFRRNYAHSRGASDIAGGFVTEDRARGDVGVLFEETRFGLAENNVMESTATGIRVMGRSAVVASSVPALAPDPVTGNRVLGNVALSTFESGFRIDSRCASQAPCTDQTRIVVDTELVDNVAVGGPAGVSSSGGVKTRISQFTSVGAQIGVSIDITAVNAGHANDSMITNALVFGYNTAGFQSSGENSWSFDHCAAAGGSGPAFDPMDAHVVSAITADPVLGACLVNLPADSPMRRAGTGGADVGANVVDRYQDGLQTAVALWDATSGAFPCGAVVAGVNDDPTQSCSGVHLRLHVGAAGCPLP